MKYKNLLLATTLAFGSVMAPAVNLMNATPVFAVEGEETPATHSITITAKAEGVGFSTYQIFSGKYDSVSGKLSDVKWGNGINSANFVTALKGIKDLELDQEKEYTAAEIAEKLSSYSNEAAILKEIAAAADSCVATVAGTASSGSNNVAVIDGLSDGYYLVKETTTGDIASSRSLLQVVGDVNVDSKDTTKPTAEKKVIEDDEDLHSVTAGAPILGSLDVNGKHYNDVADYNIHQDIPFALGATVPHGLNEYTEYTYTFHDDMDTGLSLKENTIRVYVLHGTTKTELTGDAIEIKQSNLHDNNCDFEVDVHIKTNGTMNENINEGDKIVVEFTGYLNENAQLNRLGNENKFYLEYTNKDSEGGKGTTDIDKVVVFTYDLIGNKVDATKDDEKALENAKFVLYRIAKNEDGTIKNDADGNPVKEYVVLDTNFRLVEENAWTENKAGATKLVSKKSDPNGPATFKVEGLDSGTYYLEEIEAPAGYNLLSDPIEVKITATTKNDQTYNGNKDDALTALGAEAKVNAINIGTHNKLETPSTADVKIQNKQGSTLPSTGGMGTTMLYTVGGVLVAGAAVLMVTNKRMRKED